MIFVSACFFSEVSCCTLCDGRGGVGAVRQLVGRDAGHGRRGEAPWDQVVECHQLIGSRLLPPPRPPVAEPNLEEAECV